MLYSPRCGELIMNGDPYCSHCGTTLRWIDDEDDTSSESREMPIVRLNVPIELFFSQLHDFDISDTMINCIKRDLNVSNAKNTVVNMGQEYSGADLDMHFIRKNKYFKSVDYIKYSQFPIKIEGHSFRSDFTNLKNTDWFKDAVRQMDDVSDLEFYDCGGGYGAKMDWDKGTFELKDDCEVIAHFILDKFNYRGFEVDFKNHG